MALAVPLLCSPLIARLFHPEAFGQLALYMSVSSIGAIAATGRYELAILLPRHQLSAFSLVVMALSLSALSSFILFLISLLIWILIPDWLGHTLSPIVWIVAAPLSMFALSTIQIFTYWQTREQQFSVIARSRAYQAVAMTGAQAAMGLMYGHALTLIGGHLMGVLVSISSLTKTGRNDWKKFWQRCSFRRMRIIVLHYIDVPKFMVAGNLANIVSSQLPVFMLATL